MVTLGKRLCMVIVQVSYDTVLFNLVDLYLEDSLEMTYFNGDIGETAWSLFSSPWVEFFWVSIVIPRKWS